MNDSNLSGPASSNKPALMPPGQQCIVCKCFTSASGEHAWEVCGRCVELMLKAFSRTMLQVIENGAKSTPTPLPDPAPPAGSHARYHLLCTHTQAAFPEATRISPGTLWGLYYRRRVSFPGDVCPECRSMDVDKCVLFVTPIEGGEP